MKQIMGNLKKLNIGRDSIETHSQVSVLDIGYSNGLDFVGNCHRSGEFHEF